ncbi:MULTISPECIES: pantetheine-phosphate adenylyltransferase [Olivibacter]|jgi:pantetheine-phosphate adenylyltransferase|uniref:Phosphopantetheine adenylyltransferase n=3 Tax=Sphingobacteriaceae TaxID=84566 RepID=F4C246_SPHS2|nr:MULTISPECIES: pantetheine-phosphate adenylyltransferase [Olivibacter]MCL4639051.1 pantetheine-phosphate adenylyltransferase [Olivibacter sp. UJ_SKK_5.1]MDM8175012.1 pantetheine-phosphate adenylyltransferase [Olivibacter sp. 47]MDX3913305.1 pantetheine-phosphate adenylyltransferase [Pseudosphingobacterium sp.]QEL01792.1 pantetheine-phosphate adenylyltransferase [Olivibacter sp. LS-1]
MKKRVAVFPGSFDPITNAHMDIILRAIPLFDEIHIAIGLNSSKTPLLSSDMRKTILEAIFKGKPSVHVSSYTGLTVNYCKEVGASYILRGLRNAADFDFENAIAQNNRQLEPTIETVLLFASPGFGHISSTIVRDILKHRGSIKHLVPKEVLNYI